MTVVTTLEEAVQQQITLGERDPIEIARKVQGLYGPKWITEQLNAYAEDIIADFARTRINSNRNAAMLALGGRGGTPRHRRRESPTADVLAQTKWVPSQGWIPMKDLTAPMLLEIAQHWGLLVAAMHRRIKWVHELVDLMQTHNVETLGELAKHVDLPELPPAPEIQD